MRRILYSSRYVMILPIVGLLISAVITVIVGAGRSYNLIDEIIDKGTSNEDLIAGILSLIDIFLIATVQFVISIGMSSLFFDIAPPKDVFHFSSLSELKLVVSELIILVLAVKFVQKLFGAKDGLEFFWFGASIAVVGAVLVAFSVLTGAHLEDRETNPEK